MNNRFDELTKSLAQSVTRRAAMKRFGVGLVGVVLACFGLSKAAAASGCDKACLNGCITSCLGFSPKGTSKATCHKQCSAPCGC